jgi:putative ABC transport system permease protein
MRAKEIVRGVLYSVAANKFRVFLTSLGIIIGSFTIIMVVGIGKASEDQVTEQYKRLSVETITIQRATQGGQAGMMVRMAGPGGGGGAMAFGGATTKSLTAEQAMAMPETLLHVRSVGVSASSGGTSVAYGSVSTSVTVQGVNEDYAEITNLATQYGEFFTDDQGAARQKLAVLGINVAEALFGEDIDQAVGERIMVKGLSFEVAGVLERVGGTGGVSVSRAGGGGAAAASASSSGSPDDMVYIPYEVALRYTTGNQGMRGGGGAASASTMFVALATGIRDVDAAITEIQDYIFDVVGDYTSYSVTDAGSTLSSALETANTMSRLLMVVAAIVLIVSGIGIMNVLMVAVKERTREIGIMKSIGAARGVILMEFLIEAVFISVVGGILGVCMSYLAPALLTLLNVSYSASARGILIGFLFSVATGVFFGYYPARKASRLKPVDALNSE